MDGFGGGERYTLTLAAHWSKKHAVDIFWNDPKVLSEAKKRFDIDVSNIKVVHNIFEENNLLNKLKVSRSYRLIFFLSDGSIPFSLARKNILHFQVPFGRVEQNVLKLSRYNVLVCNSYFTKANLDPVVSERSIVIYPPVRLTRIHPGRKKKQILSVGRFSSSYQAKKQAVLIDAFRRGLLTRRLTGWKLVLIGGLLSSDKAYLEELKRQASGLPIEFLTNVSYDQLLVQYSQSPIYWHAAGYDETNPRFAEHFGIAVVEAMAAGCVPVVFDGGGLPEIITHKIQGFLFTTTDELIDYTVALQTQNTMHAQMQKKALQRAKDFDESRFTERFDSLLTSLI